MKYIFLVFFSTLIFGETYLTFQRNSTALVQNGFETIEAEATATNQAAYYPLYGNALDYSENDNDGTVYGAVSIGTNYYFDGVDDYIDCGNEIDINNVEFSVSLWVTIPSDLVNNWCGLVCKENYNANKGWYFIFIRSITALQFGIPQSPVSYIIDLRDDMSHFLTATYSNGVNKIYIDGVLKKTDTDIITFDSSLPLLIGARHGNNGTGYTNPMEGYIKDCRIYDRALSATEINKIYNATK